MHHAGANVLSPTVRDLSITHRNLPLSRAHPISCPQSRSQRPVYAPPHRERSLDQIVIYISPQKPSRLYHSGPSPPAPDRDARKAGANAFSPTERDLLIRSQYAVYHQRPLPFAVLPLSSSPPPPNRDARKTGANVLSPTHRDRARDPLSDRNISSEAPRSSSTAPNPQSMRPPQGSTTIQGLRRRDSGSSGTPTRTSDDINGRGSPRCGNRIPHRKHRNITTDHTARSCATPSRSPLGADTVDFSVRISRPGKRPNVDANGRYHRTPLNTKL